LPGKLGSGTELDPFAEENVVGEKGELRCEVADQLLGARLVSLSGMGRAS